MKIKLYLYNKTINKESKIKIKVATKENIYNKDLQLSKKMVLNSQKML